MCAIVGGTVAAEVIKLVEIAAGKGQAARCSRELATCQRIDFLSSSAGLQSGGALWMCYISASSRLARGELSARSRD